LRKFSKEEISGVQKKNFFVFFFYLRDERGFLGNTTKRAPESAAGFYLAHHIVGVDDAEMDFGLRENRRRIELVQKETDHEKDWKCFKSQN